MSQKAIDAFFSEVAEHVKKVNQARDALSRRFDFRGNNAAVWHMPHEREIILSGPAGTGKTLANLAYVNSLMLKYPKARALFIRENMDDLRESTLQTFEEDVLGEDGMQFFSKTDRQYRRVYQYPNGSRIVIGGMNNPGKVLSAAYDIIYVGEATQIKLSDWETLVMRLRNYVIPFQQIIGDTNPGAPSHWIKQREAEGKLKLLPTTHQDNPAYWDEVLQDWTSKGRDYVLGTLEALSGIIYDRYRKGIWVAAEGAVYAFNDKHHLVSREFFASVSIKYKVISVDFGFRDPFVCQFWAVDTDDRMYLYREMYMSERLVSDHGKQIKELLGGEYPRMMVCDAADAEGIATLQRLGLPAVATTMEEKDIAAGIQEVQRRMRFDATGKPALFLVEGALVERDYALKSRGHPTSSYEEFGAYLWGEKNKKEKPVDAYNHGMDAMRYAVRAVELRGNHRLLAWDV